MKTLLAFAWIIWMHVYYGLYLLPMAIPYFVADKFIEPMIQHQDWPGAFRIIFWLLYTGISTGITLTATIMFVEWVDRLRDPRRKAK